MVCQRYIGHNWLYCAELLAQNNIFTPMPALAATPFEAQRTGLETNSVELAGSVVRIEYYRNRRATP
jgi:hypothetical protein